MGLILSINVLSKRQHCLLIILVVRNNFRYSSFANLNWNTDFNIGCARCAELINTTAIYTNLSKLTIEQANLRMPRKGKLLTYRKVRNLLIISI